MVAVIIGGSGSGKSEFAENLTVQLSSKIKSQRVYIATMQPFDEESRLRIKKHQNMRANKAFTTAECFTGLKNLELELGSSVLLECMSNLVANEIFSEKGVGEDVVKEVMEGFFHLTQRACNIVIVTNNIFEDGLEYDSSMKKYLEALGEINRRISDIADKVVEVVHGIPVVVK